MGYWLFPRENWFSRSAQRVTKQQRSALEEGQSKSAVTRNLEALRRIVCVGRDSGSSIQSSWVFANGAAIVLQDLDEGTEMLEVGGNRVFGALSVGVVGGARAVEGKVDVTLTLETIRDALDSLQNPNAITFVTS
jgi:hypothetical protein